MKKADVVVGKTYVMKVSGKLVPVRLTREAPYGGWFGTNTVTNREVRIRTAAKLRRELAERLVPYANQAIKYDELSTVPPSSQEP